MLSKQTLSAIAAFGMVTGVVGLGCDDPTVNIRSSGDVATAAACQTIEGNVVIAKEAGADIDLDGLTEVGGDLRMEDSTLLKSLNLGTLQSVGGVFSLKNLINLGTLSIPALTSVGELEFVTLTGLPQIGFGTKGLTEAKKVTIADTRLTSLQGLNFNTIANIDINNNGNLKKFVSQLESLTDVLKVDNNGLDFEMQLPKLETVANMTIGNVTTFAAPSLAAVNGSIKFDSNFFERFSLPNLTDVVSGTLSFVSNPQLTALAFPQLESVGGAVIVANNTKLGKIDGFPKLTEIGGAIVFRGSFTEAGVPEIESVKGGYEVISTAVLTEDTCTTFAEQKDERKMAGATETCEGEVNTANSDTGGINGDGPSNSSNPDEEGSGSLMGVNVWAMASLAALGAFFTTL